MFGGKKNNPTSRDPNDYPDNLLVLFVECARHVVKMDVGSESDPYVKVKVGDIKQRTSHVDNDADPEFNEALVMGSNFKPSDLCTVELWDYDRLSRNDLIGMATISLGDLCKRPTISLMMSRPDGNIAVHKARHAPTEVRLSVVKVPNNFPQPEASPHGKGKGQYEKHVMIISRGTRGDVQPFVALARGLAELKGWMVTIVTELPYKDFVKQSSDVERGVIRFRPSGGDTAARIDNSLAKWAMQHKSELMQSAMLARSEMEFFASEPVFYHWASTMRPDALVYGFTMANIAMILSEALHIPMLGFILQPTCIPSQHYTAVIPIDTHALASAIDKFEEKFIDHQVQSRMKQLMEGGHLGDLRQRRHLRPFKGKASETWKLIVEANSPLVVPINELTFGGRPDDWPASAVLTDFIFLRSKAHSSLSSECMQFIDNAKAAGDPLIVMAFSSMPVKRDLILEYAAAMATKCARRPRVFALVGKRDLEKEKLPKDLEKEVAKLKEEGRVIEMAGAPFGELFKYMDAIIIHGGLGTTAEALRAGVPTMVTGVLLMDQRFWGKQCEKLGVGPGPVHIADFGKVCVENIDKALAEDSEWRVNAQELASKIQGESPDGVPENVEAIARLLEDAKPMEVL